MISNKLKVGMVIKNYKVLCELLGIKVLGGASKIAQMKELERYFKFHKEGNKFIIDEVYEEVKEKMINKVGNKIPYIEYIEKLILDLLVQNSHKEKVCLSKNKLFKELKMTNGNYSFCKIRIPKLSKFVGVEEDTIDEWYESTDATLKGNLERALDNLKKQSLILWSNEISVCKIDVFNHNGVYDIDKNITLDEYGEDVIKFKVNNKVSYNFREATDSEKKFIIHTEREIMNKLNIDNKQQVVKLGMWESFKNMVNNIVLKELNIDYYFNSYKILFNEDHIYEKYEELLDLLLTKEEREIHQHQLNIAIKERLSNNIDKKQKRALQEKELNPKNSINEKIERRTKNTYKNDNNRLINNLIDREADDLRSTVRKIKLTN